MEGRVDADYELSGVGLFRFFLPLAAEGEVVGDGFDEGLFKFFDGAALEGDDVTEIHDLSVEQFGVLVVGDGGFVVVVGHSVHGSISASTTSRSVRCAYRIFSSDPYNNSNLTLGIFERI